MIIYPNRPGGSDFMDENGKHDCFAALLAATKSQRSELKDLKESLGINYEEVNIKCPKGKPMAVH